MPEILVCGSAVVDFVFEVDAFPREGRKYTASRARMVGGGCAGNAAVAITRLGGTARLLARAGDDAVGDLTLGALAAAGVDTAPAIRTSGGQSAFSSIYVDAGGERQIMAFRGAGLADDPGPLPGPGDGVLADTRWPEAGEAVLKAARAAGVPGLLDGEAPVTDALAQAASHVAFSAQGLRAFTGTEDLAAGLSAARARTDAWLCVTDGAAGTLVLAPGGVARVPAPRVDVVDTLGAGDVWHGAFILSLAEGLAEDAAARFANAAASLKCTRPGGREGIPARAEVEDFMGEAEWS